MTQEKTNPINNLDEYLERTKTDESWDIARRYVLSTELYDRSFMTGPITKRDGILPIDHKELGKSNLYANAQWRRVRDWCSFTQTSPTDMRRLCAAYENTSQYSHDLQQLL